MDTISRIENKINVITTNIEVANIELAELKKQLKELCISFDTEQE